MGWLWDVFTIVYVLNCRSEDSNYTKRWQHKPFPRQDVRMCQKKASLYQEKSSKILGLLENHRKISFHQVYPVKSSGLKMAKFKGRCWSVSFWLEFATNQSIVESQGSHFELMVAKYLFYDLTVPWSGWNTLTRDIKWSMWFLQSWCCLNGVASRNLWSLPYPIILV